MNDLKAVMRAGFVAVVGLVAAPAAADTVDVTNNNDGGAGSFRAAVEAANIDPSITSIHFQADLGTIVIASPIVYEGGQSLGIDGRGAAIEPTTPNSIDLFVATGGDDLALGDLTLRNLVFRKGANGIVVEVPATQEGQLSVSLFQVTVEDSLEFGLWIDDKTSPSPASVGLDVASSRFTRNGASGADVDGIRVDEAGDGDITASIDDSVFIDEGADGVELDERGPGDVTLTVRNSTFDNDGVLRDGGDDGLDIDERNDGSIWLQVVGSTFNGSTDDGIGLDESGDGNLRISLVQVEASGNSDSGVSADEGDAGDFEAKFILVSAEDNRDKGADLSETDEGDFNGRAVTSSFSFNDDDGIAVEQLTPGTGVLRLQHVTFERNGGAPVDHDGGQVIDVGGS